MLKYRIGGNDQTGRMSLKVVGDPSLEHPLEIMEGDIPEWKRAAVFTQTKENERLIIIEPGAVEGAVRVGDLFVRGRFKVVSRVTEEAAKAWRTFVPE